MQLNVFEHHHARDPETSKEAAETMIKSGKMARQCKEILFLFREYAPITAKQLSKRSGVDYWKISRRTSDLERGNHIHRTGEKIEGCAVWVLGKAEQQGR